MRIDTPVHWICNGNGIKPRLAKVSDEEFEDAGR